MRPTLQTYFYPQYSYKNAIYNSCEPASVITEQAKRYPNHTKLRHAWNSRRGKQVGIQADNNIAKSIKRLHTEKLTLHYMKNHTSGYVNKFWSLMCRLNLTPLETQVPVGYDNYIATACDVVCYHYESKSYCILELKTGGTKYYFKCTSTPMKYPFNSQTDCVYNQHQLQLWLTHTLYRLTNPTHNMLPPLLVRMYPEGIDTYPLEPWITTNESLAFDTLIKHLSYK